jgi:hypothetical protein
MGLFAGEQLIRKEWGSLSIDGSDAVQGAIYLTDLRIVWAPGTVEHGEAVGDAGHYDAVAITFGEIRRATKGFGPFESSLTLETPSGVFRFSAEILSFGSWLGYIRENAINMLPDGEPVLSLPKRVRFREHLLQRSKYAGLAMGFIYGAFLIAKMARGDSLDLPLHDSAVAVAILAAVIGCVGAAVYFLSLGKRVDS